MVKNFISQPVFLCGMMGAGKSTIGKILADKLDQPFHDLDEIIEKSEKMSIPKIFKTRGENEFRKIERELLIQHSQDAEGITALGGGSLQNQNLVDHVKSSGWLIFLHAEQDILIDRLSGTKNRPLLEKDQISDKIKELLKNRLPLYKQAHITVDTSTKTTDQIVGTILKKLRFYENAH